MRSKDVTPPNHPVTASQFAIILTIKGDSVTRFQMLEDSFDVSKAARR